MSCVLVIITGFVIGVITGASAGYLASDFLLRRAMRGRISRLLSRLTLEETWQFYAAFKRLSDHVEDADAA